MAESSKCLTSRQKEILSLLRKGLTNVEICKALNISANTVKVHLANIYKILDVSNRTEAVSVDIEKGSENSAADEEIHIAFIDGKSLDGCSPAKELYLSIIQALNRYRLFSINESEEASAPATYQVKISPVLNKDNTFFVTLYKGKTADILWSESLQVNADDDFELMGTQVAMQIFRLLFHSAAQTYEQNKELSPRWWYATSFANVKIDNICRDSFDEIINELEPLAKAEKSPIFVPYTLVWAYYVAITESWVNAKEYVAKIESLACAAMRKNPYSVYAQFMMAVYNMAIGNKNGAVPYLRQILADLPQCVRSRRILVQLCMFAGQMDEALHLLNEGSRFIKGPEGVLLHSTPRAFIFFLQGKFAECEETLNQVLMFHPESTLARLMLIACNNKRGNFKESEKHRQVFFEYHPNFQKSDLEQILKGIPSPTKETLLDSVSNVFTL
jgi:DNA-binding CsgD family transcriptional regulator/tetratricopeptide (TPR) repeat protein